MEKEIEKQIKKYLKDNFSVENALKPFVKSLQNVADSSMVFYGFDKVPIDAKWDSSNDDVAWINDEKCYINLDNPLVKDLSFIDRKKCIVAEMVHEIFGHWLHTDFETMHKLLDSKTFPYDSYFCKYSNYEEIKKTYEKFPDFFNNIFFSMANIVEDPVVEYLAVQKYPGFSYYIDFLTNRLSENLNENIKNIDINDIKYQDMFNLILCKARNCLPEKFEQLDFIKNINCFDDLSLMPKYEDRLKATGFIISEIWEYISKEIQDQEQMQNMMQSVQQILDDVGVSSDDQRTQNGQANNNQNNSSSSGSGIPNINSSKNDNLSNDKNDNTESGDLGKSSGDDTSDEVPNSGTNNDRGENKNEEDQECSKGNSEEKDCQNDNNIGNNSDADASSVSSDLLKKQLSNLDKLVNQNKQDATDKQFAEMSNGEKEQLQTQIETQHTKEYIHNDEEAKKNDIIVKTDFASDIDKYRSLFTPERKRIAKTLANSVSKVLKDKRKRKILYGIDNGSIFDVESYSNGSDKVFMDIKRPDKRPICSVGIMIDMSGSMRGDRIDAALNTSLVLDEFCKELKIPSLIYGHNDCYSEININKFKDFNENSVKTSSKICNMLSANGCNHDGIGLRYGLSMLSKRFEPQKFLFVISDGRPNASGYGTTQMINDMVNINKLAKKQNISIIPIAIGDDIDLLTKIYGSVVDGRDLNQLPKEITKILLKKIKKLL